MVFYAQLRQSTWLVCRVNSTMDHKEAHSETAAMFSTGHQGTIFYSSSYTSWHG